MATMKYYPEDELVEKFQSGEFGWIDYVNHHSPEWQQQYSDYCKENDLVINEESAESFVHYLSVEMEESMDD